MKKFVVMLLIIFQVNISLEIVGLQSNSYDEYKIPSITTLLKVIYISIRTNIKNLVNIYYIMLHLPKKVGSNSARQQDKIVIFLIYPPSLNQKKTFIVFHLILGFSLLFIFIRNFYYLKSPIWFSLLQKEDFLYYFSLPRSSI
ncbi:MAG: hypothetical protein QXI58_02945 [Candidatus Micrarchaeia archaeon]